MAEDTEGAPRRCFICLDDENLSDPLNSWVDPCPCTIEAHQDCMLSWVRDCERCKRPLKCPVCKSAIEMEGPWDPVVRLSDMIAKLFSETHPLMLSTALFMGIQFSMHLYGAMALWAFSGEAAMMHFIMGPQMVDGWRTAPLAFGRQRITNALVLVNVAPALLVGRVFPSWSNKIFLPTASFYGVYHAMHDKQFFTWPPSPQLAMAVFPYIRFVYYRLYKKLAMPYETKLNRQLLGLPPVQPRQEPANDGNQNRGPDRDGLRNAAQARGGNFGIMLEITDTFGLGFRHEFIVEDGVEMDEAALDTLDAGDAADEAAEAPAVEAGENGEADGVAAVAEVGDIPVDKIPAWTDGAAPTMVAPPTALAPAANHDGHPAPAGGVTLGAVLLSASHVIVTALIVPGVSFVFGEALRLVLTATPLGNPRTPLNSGGCGGGGRRGLLQQRWGRSLVGGCLFVVLRDILRVYTKTRKVAALPNRRVKNVDRPSRLKK